MTDKTKTLHYADDYESKPMKPDVGTTTWYQRLWNVIAFIPRYVIFNKIKI
jgi:hypothetical protein